MRKVVVACLLAITSVVALPAGLTSPVRASAGGPVILDGTDAGLHGSRNAGAGTLNSTWNYVKIAMQTLLGLVPGSYSNNGKIAVVGAASDTGNGSNNCGAAAYWAGQALGVSVDFYDGAAAIETFFQNLQTGASANRYKLVQIVEQNWCTNGLDNTEAAKVNAAGQAIAAHVNRGGALFAQSQTYGWLTALFPTTTASGACGGSNPILTAAGTSNFPGLTNSDIAAPWHNCFVDSTGTLPLQVLASEGGNAVIIGGASVSLPGAVTATAVSTFMDTSTQACFSVNVKEGSPLANLAGARVDMSITGTNSSVNLNTLYTAQQRTTAANGNTQQFCYTTSGAGTDTVNIEAFAGNPEASKGTTTLTFRWVTAPVITTLTGGSSSISVAFTGPNNGGGAAPTNFKYQIGNGAWTALNPVDTTTPVVISGLTDGTSYAIRIRGVYAEGDGPISNQVTGIAGAVPSAPRNVNGTPQGSGILVSWAPPLSEGGGPVLAYLVVALPGGSRCSVAGAETSCLFPGLTAGSDYSFTVYASNVIGDGLTGVSGIVQAPATTTTTAPPTTVRPTLPDATTPAAPVPAPNGSLPAVPLGQSLVTENGVLTTVTVEEVKTGNWKMSGADFQWELEIPAADTAGSSSGIVTLVRNREVEVSGSGFKSGTLVDVWLMSTPIFLGTVLVNPDGSFEGALVVPAGIEPGRHTLQANGTTPDNEIRSLNLGVQVLAGNPRLPITGNDTSPLSQIALFSLLLGAAVVLGRRFRRV